MKRYLVFDSRCQVCTWMVEEVRRAVDGRLEAISLYDPHVRDLLDQVYPHGWKYAPFLMTVEDGRVRAWAGAGAALRLGLLMGPRRAWRVWAVARRYGIVLPPGGSLAGLLGQPREDSGALAALGRWLVRPGRSPFQPARLIAIACLLILSRKLLK